MNKTFYSSCCGEEISMPDSEVDFCPSCHEWCEVICEDEETIPPKAKEFKPEINLNNYSLKQLIN